MELPAVDPGHLEDLAGVVLRCREQALDLASRARAAPPGGDWHGPGADAARAAARRDAVALLDAADGAGTAAGLLRAHAEEVREALARMALLRDVADGIAGRALDPRRGLGQ